MKHSAVPALASLAAAAFTLALSACSQIEIVPETVPTHTVKFISDGSENGNDSASGTRTTMNIDGTNVTFNWSSYDIGCLTIKEDGVAGTIDIGNSKIQDGKLIVYATFTGEATAQPKEYTAVLNGSVGNQSPDEDSYEESADVLVAKPVTASSAEAIQFQFRRPVAINKMTLSDLPASSTLKTVTVSSDKPIAGTINGDDWDPDKAGNSLTLTVNREIPASGEVVLYYTSVPAENATLSVDARVGTDSYYKRFGKTLTTTEGDVKGYSVGLNKQEHFTLTENFNAVKASSNQYGCLSEFKTQGNDAGLDYAWTAVGDNPKVYVFKNGIRLGTGKVTGSIQNSTMLARVPAGRTVTINVYAARWDTDGGDISVGYNGLTASREPWSPSIPSPTEKDYSADDFPYATSFTITKVADVNTLTLSSTQKRIIIDKVEVDFYCDYKDPQPVFGWLELPAQYDKEAIAGTTTSSLEDLIQHTHYFSATDRNYTFLYDPETYASYWVAYPLAAGHMSEGRKDSFAYDPYIAKSKQTDIRSGYGVSYTPTEYASNSYARGHQIPNADRNANATAQAQTYYATNMTPQIQNGFNGGIWLQIEDAVRGAVPSTDTLYVVTGASFRKTGGSETITTITNTNDSKVLPVPNYYWKVLLKVKRSGDSITEASAIGVWIDHREHKDEQFKPSESKGVQYVTSVDQIETWTGFDFFAALPSELQATAETNSDWSAFTGF